MNCAGPELTTQVIFSACHIRATASGISRRLSEFGLHPSGYRVGQRVLRLVVGVQVDQRGTAGGVAHAFHQFAEIRPSLGTGNRQCSSPSNASARRTSRTGSVLVDAFIVASDA